MKPKFTPLLVLGIEVLTSVACAMEKVIQSMIADREAGIHTVNIAVRAT